LAASGFDVRKLHSFQVGNNIGQRRPVLEMDWKTVMSVVFDIV